MDRTRNPNTRVIEKHGGGLILLKSTLYACIIVGFACEVITQDFDRVIAIQIDGGSSQQVTVGDSLFLSATAINAAGDPVPEAEISWAILDIDSGQVGFTLDPFGVVIGVSEGQGSVQARVENLRSDPIQITVLPADTTTSPFRQPRPPLVGQ